MATASGVLQSQQTNNTDNKQLMLSWVWRRHCQLILNNQEQLRGVLPSPPGPGRSSGMCGEGMSHGGPGTTRPFIHEATSMLFPDCLINFPKLLTDSIRHQSHQDGCDKVRGVCLVNAGCLLTVNMGVVSRPQAKNSRKITTTA